MNMASPLQHFLGMIASIDATCAVRLSIDRLQCSALTNLICHYLLPVQVMCCLCSCSRPQLTLMQVPQLTLVQVSLLYSLFKLLK